MNIQKCPVCEGKGCVPGNFYGLPEAITSGDMLIPKSTDKVECRSCLGKGVLLLSQIENQGQVLCEATKSN